MKVVIISRPGGPLAGLVGPMVLEGEIMSPLSQAEVVITDRLLDTSVPSKVIQLGGPVPDVVLACCGCCPGREQARSYYSRAFGPKGWGEQTLHGVEVKGLLDRGMGAPVTVGYASTFGGETPEEVETLWTSGSFLEALQAIAWGGWVSLGVREGRVVGGTFGLPGWGIFNVLEGIEGGIVESFLEPQRLLQSKTLSSLVSRWPWPTQASTEDRVVFDLSDSMRRHGWVLDATVTRRGWSTNSTTLAVMTAWGGSWYEVAHRVLRTCENFLERNTHLEALQFRTDLRSTLPDLCRPLGIE